MIEEYLDKRVPLVVRLIVKPLYHDENWALVTFLLEKGVASRAFIEREFDFNTAYRLQELARCGLVEQFSENIGDVVSGDSRKIYYRPSPTCKSLVKALNQVYSGEI